MNLVDYFHINLSMLPPHTIDQEVDEKQLHITFTYPPYFIAKSKRKAKGQPYAFEFGKLAGIIINESGVMAMTDVLIGANGYGWYFASEEFTNTPEMSYIEYTLEDLYNKKFFLYGKQNFKNAIAKNSHLIIERLFLATEVLH